MEQLQEEEQLFSISYNDDAGILVCSDCKHGVENIKSLRSHFRTARHSNHGEKIKITAQVVRRIALKGTKWEKEWHNVSCLPECLGGKYRTATHVSYREAPRKSIGRLPRVKGLPVFLGKQCPKCEAFCARSEEQMIAHLMSTHSVSREESIRVGQSLQGIPVQTLGLGAKERYFPVHVPDLGELCAFLSPENGQKSSGIVTRSLQKTQLAENNLPSIPVEDFAALGDRQVHLPEDSIHDDLLAVLDEELKNITDTIQDPFLEVFRGAEKPSDEAERERISVEKEMNDNSNTIHEENDRSFGNDVECRNHANRSDKTSFEGILYEILME